MEKRKKFKILKRILPIICAVLCIATALTTPISAIVDSSGGTGQNYDITGRSSFPMTVGLAFDLDEDNNVTFASDIGGYGQEYNTTQGGTDTFFWTSNASTASQLEGQLEYEFLATRVQDKEYRNSFPLMTNYGYSKASYRPIRITTKVGSDLTNGKDCSSVVYRMSDVVINSTVIRVGNYFGNLQEDFDIDIYNADSIRNSNAYRPNAEDYQYLVPHVVLPDISTTAGYYGVYNVIATITDEWGKQWDLNYSIPIDTRGATTDTLVPFLPMSIFDSYGKTKGDMAYNIGMSNTVVLNDYYGYLDIDYYEYVDIIQPSYIDVKVYSANDTLVHSDGFTLTDDIGLTFSQWASHFSQSGYSVQVTENGVELTYTSGSDTYIGYIYNGIDKVYGSTVIAEGITYGATLNYVDDELYGTWVFNNTINLSTERLFLIYSNESSSRECGKLIFDETPIYLYCNTRSDATGRWFGFQTSSNDTFYSTSSGDYVTRTHDLSGATLVIYDGWLYDEAGLDWLKANATKQSSASTVAVAEEPTPVSTDTPTTTSTAEWVKVEGTEYGRSAMLTLPLWDTSHWTNTNNADYKVYSLPTVQKFLTDVQKSTNIPTDIQQDYTSWIGTATAGFLNMELMPNFSIGGVLAILIGFSIVMLFLKYFAGG